MASPPKMPRVNQDPSNDEIPIDNLEGTSSNVIWETEQHSSLERLQFAESDFLVTPEFEFISEFGPQSAELLTSCTKHPQHADFIPVPKFQPEHLPVEWRREWMVNYIKCLADLTVMVDVKYTSQNRPDHYPGIDLKYPYSNIKGSSRGRRCGTGYIIGVDYYFYGGPCPCPECVTSGDPQKRYWEVFIHTSSHVIFDSSEAASSVFHLFYDSEEAKDKVRYVYGTRCLYDDDIVSDDNVNDPNSKTFDKSFTDRNCVMGVSHDSSLIRKLDALQKQRLFHVCNLRKKLKRVPEQSVNTGVVISHPHGGCKKVSVGKLLHISHGIEVAKNTLSGDDHKNILKKGQLCRLPSTRSEGETGYSGEQIVTNENSSTKETADTSDVTSSKICDLLLTPGKSYTLPFDIKFIPPPKAPYSWRCPFDVSPWRTFPPGTQFVNSDTGEYCIFPPEAEFSMNSSDLPFFLHTHPDNEDDYFNYYLTYDIPTCRGSSGAGIIDFGFHSYLLNHEGVLPDGTNKSGENIDLPTVSDYNCVWSLSEYASLFQADKYVMFTSPDILLFMFGVSLDHLKQDEDRGPIITDDVDEDDEMLSFIRWRLRRRLKIIPFDKWRLTKEINNQMHKVLARRRKVYTKFDEEFGDGGDMGEEIDINVDIGKISKNVRMRLYHVFVDTKAEKRKGEALAYVLEMEKYLMDDNVEAGGGGATVAADDAAADDDDDDDNEKQKDTNTNNDTGDDDDDDDDDDIYLIERCPRTDADTEKNEKIRKWNVLLDKLRDEKAERRMIELYAKHLDSSFSLSQSNDDDDDDDDDDENENEMDNSDDDTLQQKREMLRQKLLDSMKNNTRAWRKIKYHVKNVDQSFSFWEEDNDDNDNEDADDEETKASKILKRTKDSLRRRLLNKLRGIDAGELEWDEIRRLELIVCPPSKRERRGHGLDFLMDTKFQRSIRFVLGVDLPSEEADADDEEYPILNQLLAMYEKPRSERNKHYPKTYIHPRLFDLLTSVKDSKREWNMVIYYIATIDPSFNFFRESVSVGMV